MRIKIILLKETVKCFYRVQYQIVFTIYNHTPGSIYLIEPIAIFDIQM